MDKPRFKVPADGSSRHRGSKDLAVRTGREEGITSSPPPTRETSEAVYARSCMDFFKRKFCGGSKQITDDDDSRRVQPPSEVTRGRQRAVDALEDREVNSTRIRELLRYAQENIWGGHLDEQEVALLMKKDKVASREIIDETLIVDEETILPEKLTLNSGIVGVFKKEDKYEVAACKVDRLLGLNMVPLTVLRKKSGETGSLQLWVNNIIDPELRGLHLPNDALFFDLLIANKDRGVSGPNFGFVGPKSDHRVVLYDNGFSFSLESLTGMLQKFKITDVSQFKPSPSVLEKARKLDMKMLEPIENLTQEQKDSLLDRRDELIAAIDR